MQMNCPRKIVRFEWLGFWLLSSVLLIGTVGCGDGRPSRVPVAGVVTVDGEIVTEGSIKFKPAEGGRSGNGRIDANGKYSLTTYTKGDGLPPGEFIVAISAFSTISESQIKWLVPQKYSSATTSGLTATVEEETGSMNFDLTWQDSGSSHSEPWVESFDQ